MQRDEWDLLQRYVRDSSQDAFAELAGRYVNFVYGCCVRQLGDPHLAEDVTQGVFLVLATKSNRLKQETVLSAWLFQVARYACGTAIRMRSRRRRHESTAARPPTAAAAQSEVHPMDELKPLLDEAVSRLRQTDRQAVLLRYFEGRSVKEVAVALGVSENTASQQLSRAVEKLRTMFAQRGMVLEATTLASAIAAASRTNAPSATHSMAVSAAKQSGAIPAAVTIAQATLHTMKWAYIRSAIATAAGMILIGFGGVLAHQAISNRSAPVSTPVASAPASTGPSTTPATQPDKAMVDNHPAQAQSNAERGARRRVRYIQVSTMRQVNDVRRRLKTEDFGNVARDMSENGASRELGGEMPPFGATDANYPAAIRAAAFALNVGQVSDAVQYKGAFYIIELEEILPPRAAPQTRPGS